MPITSSRKAPVFENVLVTERNWDDVLAACKAAPVFAFDTETSGLYPELGDYIAGCSISTPDKVSFYFPFHHISPGGAEVWLYDDEGEEDPEPLYVKSSDEKRMAKVAEWLQWYDGEQDTDPPHGISSVDEFPAVDTLWPGNLPLEQFKRIMALLTGPRVKVGHNTKYDLLMALWTARHWFPNAPQEKREKWEQAVLWGNWHDTMVAAKNMRMDGWVGLKRLAAAQWPDAGNSEKELIALMKRRGHTKDNTHYHRVRPTEMYDYACTDTELTLRLFMDVHPRLLKQQGLEQTYEQERIVMLTLTRMEYIGIPYSPTTNREQMEIIEELRTWALQQCHKLAGKEFNPNSEQQLAEVFLEVFDIDMEQFCQTTAYVNKQNQKRARNNEKPMRLCMKKEVLDELDHPLGHAVTNYRHFSAFMSTYVDPLPALAAQDGRIHTHYRQTKVVTGRLSSESPNLQNPPKRKYTLRGERVHKKWKELNSRVNIRDQFVPSKGKVFILADYSQIEYRLMGCYTEDPLVVQAFNEDKDLHQETTENICRVVGREITDRDGGKACNFLQIYGGGVAALMAQLNVNERTALIILDAYHEVHPRVREFTDEVKQALRETGYIMNWYGVRYYLPPDLAYMGVNRLCQGGAAYMIKEKMAAINAYMVEHDLHGKINLLLQIHDELIFECDEDYVDEAVEWIVPIMEDFGSDVPGMREAFPLPIKVDVEVAPKALGTKLEWKGSLRKSLSGK